MKQYPVKGTVLSTDPAQGSVMLDAAAIPGFMDAMAMPYKLHQPNQLSELHPGDKINATLYTSDAQSYLDDIVITAQARPDYKPAATYHVPVQGDAVPDFKLLNQSDRMIDLRQFRGKVLLITFIYTRCPLADYCPRMSRNFAELNKQLMADPRLRDKTHLLSISFDPAYDTPKVLKSYGEAYTGNYTQEKFTHWDFAAPPERELPKVLQFFDVGATPEQNHTITHSLSTAVIAPDGKIYQWYPTNDWTPDQLMQDVKQLLKS
jgi:protein SCO1/2